MKRSGETANSVDKANGFRLLPLTIAGILCSLVAIGSGFTAWYFLGSKSPLKEASSVFKRPIPPAASPTPFKSAINANSIAVPSPTSEGANSTPESTPELSSSPTTISAPAGEVEIERGEIVLGGNETGLPLQRKFVNSFSIGETEVTNAQFRLYLEATNSNSQKITIPEDKDDEPVTNITWKEAKAYCDWLSEQLKTQVRLPTEAEWEMAARGSQNFKYPWGNQWREDAADSKEKNGKIRPVKSFPVNKSPFGVYDMAGNVWEWTADEQLDEAGKVVRYNGPKRELQNEPFYVLKGGAAVEEKKNISAQSRTFLPMSFRLPYVGFRYVIMRNKL